MADRNSKTAAVWFEMPVGDLDRAVDFYETVLGVRLKREDQGGRPGAVFPYDRPHASGSLVLDKGMTIGGGPVVYLNVDGRLAEVSGRVVGAGGQVLTPRIDLPAGQGSFVQILDTEGNRVGLHSA